MPTEEELRAAIDEIGPRKELHTGIRFLHLLLDTKGVKAVVDFVTTKGRILDKEGLLENYDFSKEELALVRKASFNFYTRRNFLRTLGWTIPGITVFTDGLARVGHQLTGSPALERTAHWIEKNLGGAEAAIIGAALISEGVEKWHELKLHQVANAVAEMVERQERSSTIER